MGWAQVLRAICPEPVVRPIAKLLVNHSKAPRLIKLVKAIHWRVVHAECGLPPGSSFNQAMVRAYVAEACDTICKWHPRVELSAYVDDTTMTVHGKEGMAEGEQGRDIVKCLNEVTIDMQIVCHTALEVGIAMDKPARQCSLDPIAGTEDSGGNQVPRRG